MTEETRARIAQATDTLKALGQAGYRAHITTSPQAGVPLGEGLSDTAVDLLDLATGNSYDIVKSHAPGGFELFEAGLFELYFTGGEVYFSPTNVAREHAQIIVANHRVSPEVLAEAQSLLRHVQSTRDLRTHYMMQPVVSLRESAARDWLVAVGYVREISWLEARETQHTHVLTDRGEDYARQLLAQLSVAEPDSLRDLVPFNEIVREFGVDLAYLKGRVPAHVIQDKIEEILVERGYVAEPTPLSGYASVDPKYYSRIAEEASDLETEVRS